MSYTPINWQTGDTITAEKMNKMDNGWSVGTTEQVCFNGTVTTSESSGYIIGDITTESAIAADTIFVTFNGTEYECQNISSEGGYEYGAPYSGSYDFSVFPFNIYVESVSNAIIATENTGAYTLSIKKNEESIEMSTDFQNAVKQCIPKMLRCIDGETTKKEADNVINAGGIVYFTVTDATSGSKLFFINEVDSTCTFFPESTNFEAGFDRDSGLFYIEYLSGE